MAVRHVRLPELDVPAQTAAPVWLRARQRRTAVAMLELDSHGVAVVDADVGHEGHPTKSVTLVPCPGVEEVEHLLGRWPLSQARVGHHQIGLS